MRRGRGEGEEGKEVPFLSLPPFFASLLPLFPLGTPDTQAKGMIINNPYREALPETYNSLELKMIVHL